jgi:hypothetical protein
MKNERLDARCIEIQVNYAITEKSGHPLKVSVKKSLQTQGLSIKCFERHPHIKNFRGTRLSLKWYLHRRENITCCRYRQQWQFEKMGEFLLKLHRLAKLLDPHHMCVRTLIEQHILDTKAGKQLSKAATDV